MKIIKLGMDTRAVLARFQSEQQALALMEHPNIARVYEAGSSANGRPYFVMEYVQGVPITEYATSAVWAPARGWSCFYRWRPERSMRTRKAWSTAT